MADPARQVERLPKNAFNGIKFTSEFDRAQFRAWLGRLQQRRKHLRTIEPYKDIGMSACLIKRLVKCTYPWTIDQFPGRIAMLAHVMGVRTSTAESWLAKGTMSRKAAVRAAQWLEAKAAEFKAIASEIERLPEGKAPFGRPRAEKKKAPG